MERLEDKAKMKDWNERDEMERLEDKAKMKVGMKGMENERYLWKKCLNRKNREKESNGRIKE